jgi:hypothetical protein
MSGLGVGFKLEITNCGRRPVTIEEGCIVDHRQRAFSYRSLAVTVAPFDFTLPYTLYESKQVTLTFPQLPSASRDPRDDRKTTVSDTICNLLILSSGAIGSSLRGRLSIQSSIDTHQTKRLWRKPVSIV